MHHTPAGVSGREVPMNEVTEILRLHEMDRFTYKQISASVGWGKTKVGETINLCKLHGLTYEQAAGMSDEEIDHLLHPDRKAATPKIDDPDWEHFYRRLKSSRRMTRAYLYYEEYRPSHPDGLSYSQFCARFRKWMNDSGHNVIMPQERIPGRDMLIDWVGDTLDCVLDTGTGKAVTAYFFVTTLGDSSYPFVEAFPDMTQESWMQAHLDAFRYYGGLPKILIPDNTKTAVIRRKMYDTELNHSYLEMAVNYQMAILPARVRAPRDKPDVESSVGWLETWLLEWLRGKIYTSFSELNRDIRKRVDELCDRPFTSRPGSRRSVFEELDKPELRPLPKDEYEYYTTEAFRRVPNNYHIEYKGFYYSVPYLYVGRPGYMHIYPQKLEIYLNNGTRIAVHQRHFTGQRYVTIDEHMPQSHLAVAQLNYQDGNYYREHARFIGEKTYAFIDALLKSVHVEPQAYRACMGILNFARKYGDRCVEAACSKALSLHTISYTSLKNILKSSLEEAAPKTAGEASPVDEVHENLRTGEWR